MNYQHNYELDEEYPQLELFSEIKPNLFMGGTDDLDTIFTYLDREPSPLPFDTIATMYAWARPATWKIQEVRYAFPDSTIDHIDLKRLRSLVDFTYQQWKEGDRVLVRCQAGLNRSGLVTALLLIKDDLSPSSAIELIRVKRSSDALFNRHYSNWLIKHGEDFIKL